MAPDLQKNSFIPFKECLKPAAYSSAYLLLVVLFLSTWDTMANHGTSPLAFLFFAIATCFSLVYGRLLFTLLPHLRSENARLTLEFLCGYFTLNTLGFVMSFITPFTVACNLLILGGGGILALL